MDSLTSCPALSLIPLYLEYKIAIQYKVFVAGIVDGSVASISYTYTNIALTFLNQSTNIRTF